MHRSTDLARAGSLGARLLALLARELPRAIELRHVLHATPELAHEERRTSARIAAELQGTAIVSAAAETGLLALVGTPGVAAPVAVRAELDGLPIAERTDAPFSAGGEAMHACGHDVHMAALVALARAAAALGDELPAPLLAVFQPSEEAYPSGARELADGELAAARAHAIVAAHIHPDLPWGTVALDDGAVNAASDSVEIVVEGAPSHGAYPHLGRDPILAIAQIVVALHAQAGRRIDPLGAAVLNVGVLEAGRTENVVPDRARARISLRTLRAQDREALREMVQEVVHGVAAAHGCRGVAELIPGEPALENDGQIVARARALLAGAGFARAPEWRSCGSDDFAFYGELAPIAMAFVGLAGAPGFAERPLHHPQLLPPDQAVGAVARAQALLYLAATASG
ncbi:MAG TPA: amidohydrolase [Solirubrobacteraceae bacterium]|jgi:amidohydrolase|nr:amidohydrolase [Solirubrobacteraceae bacterium]